MASGAGAGNNENITDNNVVISAPNAIGVNEAAPSVLGTYITHNTLAINSSSGTGIEVQGDNSTISDNLINSTSTSNSYGISTAPLTGQMNGLVVNNNEMNVSGSPTSNLFGIHIDPSSITGLNINSNTISEKSGCLDYGH